MDSIGKNIKMLRISKGITQKDLADLLGVSSYTTIGKWENGSNFPQGRELIKLSRIFNVSVDEILGLKLLPKTINKLSEYKYLSTSISAGIPIDIESIKGEDIQTIEIPDKLMGKYAGSKNVFITKISGDSMDKVIPDGSFIAVKKVKDVKELQDNDIVLFSNQHEYSVKRYFKINNKVVFKPDSTNPDHFDQVITTDDDFANLIIYGKVVWYAVNI